MAPRIFISHKSSDLATVEKMVQLLVEATGVRREEIRCTSVPGCTLPFGSDVPATLAREIREATVFVCLITEEAARSAYVLFEAGARWGADKDVLPLLGPGTTPDLLPAPIAHRHAAQMARRTDMLQFVNEVAQGLGVSLRAGNAYARTLAEIVRTSEVPVATRNGQGFCIRCHLEIPLDPMRPYCQEDYEVWARYWNYDYEDSFCHRCGKPFPATKAKPLCESCDRELRASPHP